MFDSGKGKRYFFFNYERYHLNEVSPVRTRQVLTAEGQTGLFRYGTGGASTANLFTIAAANGLPSTIDPTVNNILSTIRTATTGTGAFQAAGTGGLYYRQPFNFNNPGQQRRRFLAVRTDFNIGKHNALEVIYNEQPFRSNVDFLNSIDPQFPGFNNAGAQNSDRRSLSTGLRTNFGTNVVNQFRYSQVAGWLKGSSRFDLVGGNDFFTSLQNGYNLTWTAATGITSSGVTSPTIRNASSSRVSPTQDITDNVTVVSGNHTVSFGGELKKARTVSNSLGQIFQNIGFGVVATDTAVLNAINATTLPGASATEIANAQGLYAMLTGRVSTYTASAVLGANGKYALNGSRDFEIEENTNGLYVQDTWHIRPNLTISGGIRWQPTLGTKMNTANYSVLNNFNMLYDVSGPGNLYTPGITTGVIPTVRGNAIGEKAYKNDLNNWAPSIGGVWSPNGGSGFLGALLGKSGTSVFRGGWSRSFIREGTLIIENSLGQNAGGAFSLNRNTGNGNLTIGTLFRTAGNPNLVAPAFSVDPVYPRALTAADSAFAFSPDFHTGYVDSYSFGYQRQFGRDTVLEFRYVGNRGKEMQNQYSLNETNAIENGFGAEFALAQQNLIANINAGRGANFRYFGAGTGTNPLPIMVSYFNSTNADPTLAASYTGTSFANATFVNQLSPGNPQVLNMAATIESNFRATGTAPGLRQRPLNFFNNCPTTVGFCFLFDNSEKSWYDSAVVEFRRRLSDGFRFQASYVFGKSFTNGFSAPSSFSATVGTNDQSNVTAKTLRNPGLDKSFSQIDIRHAFKFDATWDLPFGQGQKFVKSGFLSTLIGGWSILPTLRWQSGAPILMSDIQLVGMSQKDLQKAVGVYYNQTIVQPSGASSVANVTYLPADIINNTIRAFTTTGSSVTGYGAGQGPAGRFIAPAGYNNCMQRTLGECGFRKFVLYGPDFFKVDATIIKRIPVGERRNIEMRLSMFDVLNRTNWRLGGWTGNVNNITAFTGTFGQMLAGWSYQDPSGSNDPGGRLMDIMIRFNF